MAHEDQGDRLSIRTLGPLPVPTRLSIDSMLSIPLIISSDKKLF